MIKFSDTKLYLKTITLLLLTSLLSSCAGTITTLNYYQTKNSYKNAYIISSDVSQYIKFKFGTLKYNGLYIPPKDDAPVDNDIIGNTDEVIKLELAKYGINATIGKKGDEPTGYDLIIEYSDTWRWDFKKILDKLDIYFISPDGNKIIAKSTYNIYHNKELHDFPTPEKEVPKMIKELLEQ